MKLNFEYDSDSPEGRERYRAAVPGLVAKLSGFDGAFSLLDVSGNGMAIRMERTDQMRPGMEAVVEVMSLSQRKILRCSVQLVRINKEKGIVAFEFVHMSAFQEASLDKLVLEVQKRKINKEKGILAGTQLGEHT